MEPYRFLTNERKLLDSPYEVKCRVCNGDIVHNSYNKDYEKCYRCNGEGYILTDEGQLLLDFIKRRLG